MWSEIIKITLYASALAAVIMWALHRGEPHRGQPPKGSSPALLRLFLVGVFIAFTGFLALIVVVDSHIHETIPNPDNGRIYSWNEHGIIYLTKNEHFAAEFFEWTAVVGWAVGFGSGCVMGFRQKRIEDQKYERPPSS